METQGTSAAGVQEMRRYGCAILAAIAALVLRSLLVPLLGDQNPYHTVWAAVVFSAWYCGVGPSILTAVVDLIGVWYWFLPPYGSFQLAHPRTDIAGMVGFLIFSGCIVAAGETTRRSFERSKAAEEDLRTAHAQLERKVRERTAELVTANENLQELTGHLQQLRDEERRQIARDLHDSVGQLLAALNMNIAAVRSHAHKLDPAAVRAVDGSAMIADQISKEIHTISHLLHPPLLDLAGLASAVRWYVDGFSERSKIRVTLEIPAELSRLSNGMEMAIFRLIQECLTNIHRHSGSDTAAVMIREEAYNVVVEVKDAGKGIPLEKQLDLSSDRSGLGFRGMRERLRQFGGGLDIQSDSSGTRVTATLPRQAASGNAVESEKAS